MKSGMLSRIFGGLGRLRRARGGLALLEFALTLPLMLLLSLTGAEITNYIITRMRISQLALQLADNASRIGEGSQLAAKTISEADINDLLTGAGLQSGALDLYGNGRVIVSQLVPLTSPNPTNQYRIEWQRCRGNQTSHASTYGKTGDILTGGMGPTGQKAMAPDGGATMFVEVYYQYQPLIKTSLSPSTTMVETASMMVRDTRDTSDDSVLGALATHPGGVYKVSGVTASTC